MPTHKQITITLVTQGNVALPEYNPPLDVNEILSPDVPIASDEGISEVTVYVPAQANTQFWIEYSIARPYQPHEAWFFKLFVGQLHVVSWVCDATNGYKGRMRYGLFDAKNGQPGAKGIEKRVLKFGGTAMNIMDKGKMKPEKVVEVKAFRIWDKTKAQVEVAPVGEKLRDRVDRRVGLSPAGPLERGHPLNRYQVRLVDSLDSPYVNFRFLYRTQKELNDLGITTIEETTSIGTGRATVSSEEMLRAASIRQRNLLSSANPNKPRDLRESQVEIPSRPATTTLRSCLRRPPSPPSPQHSPPISRPFALGVRPSTPSPPNPPSDDGSPIRIPRFNVAAQPSTRPQPTYDVSIHQDNPLSNTPRINFRQRVAALYSSENNLPASSAAPSTDPILERQLRPKDSLGMLRGVASMAKRRKEREKDGERKD